MCSLGVALCVTCMRADRSSFAVSVGFPAGLLHIGDSVKAGVNSMVRTAAIGSKHVVGFWHGMSLIVSFSMLCGEAYIPRCHKHVTSSIQLAAARKACQLAFISEAGS